MDMMKDSLKKKIVFWVICAITVGLLQNPAVGSAETEAVSVTELAKKATATSGSSLELASTEEATAEPTDDTQTDEPIASATGTAVTPTDEPVASATGAAVTTVTLQAYTKVKTKKGYYIPKATKKKMTYDSSKEFRKKYKGNKYYFTYKSKNKKIASVTDEGVVKGLKRGKTTIEVTVYKNYDFFKTETVNVVVQPTIYIKYLTNGKYIVNSGKKYRKKHGIQIKVVGCDKSFQLFYKAGRKKEAVYMKKKWSKKTKSIPNKKNTWIPLSGKKYKFYISDNKKTKKRTYESNEIKWNI